MTENICQICCQTMVAVYKRQDSEIEMIPLTQQKELKSVKNMVIREAVRFGEGYLYLEEAETGMERDVYKRQTSHSIS